LLAPGQRKSSLQERFDEFVQGDLEGRVLVFDADAASQSARLAADRKARGRPVDMRDTFIAGIALARRATLATRNTRHFEDLFVPVVNPWDDNRRTMVSNDTTTTQRDEPTERAGFQGRRLG
jgi:toxin FitB